MIKTLRVMFKTWLARRRLIIEFCHDCGVEQPVVWSAPDWLWAQVMGGPYGIACPTCFDKRARAAGIALRWVSHEMDHE